MIKYKFTNDNVLFYVDGVNPVSWCNLNSNGLNWIYQLVSEEKAKIIDERVSFPISELVKFPLYILKEINIPALAPYFFKIETQGNVLSGKFEIDWSFTEKSRPVFGKLIDKCFYKIAGKVFFINDPIFSSIELIEKIKNIPLVDDKLSLLNQLKQILPKDSLESDSRIKSFNMVQATRLTLDIIDHENFIITPELILPDDEDVSLLTPEQNDKFKDDFLKMNKVSKKYQVNRNSFVILDGVVFDVCKEIKNLQSKTPAERRLIYFNPAKYFKKMLYDKYPDSVIENLFVENEVFSSNRISHIGIWEPKVHAFVPKGKNNWIPKDCITIKIDDVLIYVDPDKIEDVIEKVKTAQKEDKDIVTIGGVTVPINEILFSELENCSSKFKSLENETSKIADPPKNRKEALERYVSIIKDNLDKDEYFENASEEVVLDERMPEVLKTRSLYDYQKVGVKWLQDSYQKGKRGVLLADDMGLGKTLQVLTFLAWLKEHMDKGSIQKRPILIVGPTSLLQNWRDEHDMHLYGPGLGVCVEGFGPKLKQIKDLAYNESVRILERSDWVLTTYDTLRDQEKFFRPIKWACIVFDEAQAIKNPKSLKTDMAKAMDGVFSIAVTGTPVENSLCDLWCISDAVYPGILGLYKSFSDRFVKTKDNLSELTSHLQGDNPQFLKRRLKENCLDGLPKKIMIVKNKVMPDVQAAAYDEIIQNVKSGAYNKAQFQAIHDLKRVSLYNPKLVSGDVEVLIKSSARLQLLVETLDEIKLKDEKVLVFLENRELQTVLIPFIQKRYNLITPPLLINGATKGKQRKVKVDDFQARQDGFDVMVISPKAGGTGLTITKANHVIHLDRWWNPAVEDQCNDRCFRIGQNKDVIVYILRSKHPSLGDGSFDIILHLILETKRRVSKNVLIPPELSKEEMESFCFQVTGEDIELKDSEERSFYLSKEWQMMRSRALARFGYKCMKCDAINVRIEVDHIKPRSKYPELELSFENLQVLCADCNRIKSNLNETDYRKTS
jgi:hypothetical protein